MDIVTIRRKRLRYLIDTDYEGSQAAFVEKTGINQGELSGLLRKKSFGEKRARSLEEVAGLPGMYFDRPELGQSQESEATPIVAPTKTSKEVTALTSEQKQILSLMESIGTEALEALQKVTSLLLRSNPSSPPRSTRTRIIPDAPVQFPPLKNATTSKRRESDG